MLIWGVILLGKASWEQTPPSFRLQDKGHLFMHSSISLVLAMPAAGMSPKPGMSPAPPALGDLGSFPAGWGALLWLLSTSPAVRFMFRVCHWQQHTLKQLLSHSLGLPPTRHREHSKSHLHTKLWIIRTTLKLYSTMRFLDPMFLQKKKRVLLIIPWKWDPCCNN